MAARVGDRPRLPVPIVLDGWWHRSVATGERVLGWDSKSHPSLPLPPPDG